MTHNPRVFIPVIIISATIALIATPSSNNVLGQPAEPTPQAWLPLIIREPTPTPTATPRPTPTPAPTPRPTPTPIPTTLSTAEPPMTKKGVAITYLSQSESIVRAVGASIGVTYSMNPPDWDGIELIPMVHNHGYIEALQANPDKLKQNWRVSQFNEPDLHAPQANMTPYEAAVDIHWLEETYPNVDWISPAPSHLHPEWLDQCREEFHDLYGRYPNWKYVAVHAYGPDWFVKQHVEAGIAKCQAWDGCEDVMLTEFGYIPNWSPSQGIEGVWKVIPWMEDNEWVDSYFWFGTLIRCDEDWWPGPCDKPTYALGLCGEWDGSHCVGDITLSEYGWWYSVVDQWICFENCL